MFAELQPWLSFLYFCAFLPLESPFSLCVACVWLWIVSPWFFLVLGHTLPTAIHHSPLQCLDVDLNSSMSELEFSLLPRCDYVSHVPVSVLGSSVFPVRETRTFQVTADFFSSLHSQSLIMPESLQCSSDPSPSHFPNWGFYYHTAMTTAASSLVLPLTLIPCTVPDSVATQPSSHRGLAA